MVKYMHHHLRKYVYTYAYPLEICPPERPHPIFYVGKGTGQRMYVHEYEARAGHNAEIHHIIRQIWAAGLEVVKEVVLEIDDDAKAFAYEQHLITIYGLDNLVNKIVDEQAADMKEACKRKSATPILTARISAKPLIQQVQFRKSRDETTSSAVTRDIERYYTLLRMSLPRFSENETLFLLHALKPARYFSRIAHSLDEYATTALSKHFNLSFDADALLERLKGLSRIERTALIDAVECFWLDRPSFDEQEARQWVRDAGLIQEEQ